mgnify:CR=1 FL=1
MNSGLRSGGRKRAFTMVELMGATTIAIFLIILLYNLFDKVQSVFVVGQSRALAMEDGRIAMDLVAEDFLLLESGVGGERPNLLWHEADSVLGVPANRKFYMITNRVGQLAPPFVGFQSTNNLIAPPTMPRPTDVEFNLYHHDCSFFRGGDYWKYIRYKFGGRENYRTILKQDPADVMVLWNGLDRFPKNIYNTNQFTNQFNGETFYNTNNVVIRNPVIDQVDTPVGALWVYYSPDTVKGRVVNEEMRHNQLIRLDLQNLNQGGTGLDELSAYEKLIDGVIHFRVRASRSEALGVKEYVPSENPFSGFEDVRYVEVELAILDRKLLKEVEEGMEQQLEGLPPVQKRLRRLERIAENLDRVYFFKKLINLQGGGGNE